MNKKIFIMILVVIVAIFIGVAITVRSVNDPQLRRLLNQQSELLSRVKNIERQLGMGPAGQQDQGEAFAGDAVRRLEMKIDSLAKIAGGNPRPGQPSGQGQRFQEDLTTVHDISVGSSAIMGDRDAPITIVSFVDLECPFSAKFQPVIADVVKAYPKQVKQVLKNYPLAFHKQGLPAAKAAMAAGEQGKYWEMIDLILKNQRVLSDEKYKEMASDLGLDIEKFTKDIESKKSEWEEDVKADIEIGQQVGVRGTPTYYLNGRKTLSRSVEAFKAEIEGILKENSK